MAISDLDSITKLLAQQDASGALFRFFDCAYSSSTAATTSSGGVTMSRSLKTFTIPSVGAGLTGYCIEAYGQNKDLIDGMLIGLRYHFGSYSNVTDTFTVDSTMPTSKSFRISGTTYSESTSTLLPIAYITTLTGASTTVFTFTYVNQDGNTSTSAAITIPLSSSATTAFLLSPHLATGDTGVRSISAVTRTSGPATGVIDFVGLIPVSNISIPNSSIMAYVKNTHKPYPPVICEPNEILEFYRYGSIVTASEMTAVIHGRPI